MAPPVRRTAGPAGRKTSGAPRVSFLPEDAGGGFEIPEGDYLWKDVYTDLHDYNGTVVPGEPAIFLVLESLKGKEEFTVQYLAGHKDFITPSDDKLSFIHPDGESTPQFFKQGDAIKLIKSVLDGGYPRETMEDNGFDVSKLVGIKAHMIPTPKNPGKGKQVDPNKTVPIVEKIIALPGQKGTTVPTQRTAGAKPTAATGAASRGVQRATQQDNGEPEGEVDIDNVVMQKVYEALDGRPDKKATRSQLAGAVWLTAKNAKDADASNYRGIAGNMKWLEEHAEEGGWQIDGDTVTLAG